MGTIASGIQAMKEKVELCLKAARRVSPVTLNKDVKSFVFECFEYLTPLSTRVKRLDIGGPDKETLVIGKWIKYRDRWNGLRPIVNEEHFYKVIVRYGEQIKPLVRNGISKEFSSLVDLAPKFKTYEPVTVRIDIPPTTIYEHDPYPWTVILWPKIASSISLNTGQPLCVEMFDGNGARIYSGELDRLSTMLAVEDAIDYVIKLYEKAEAEISGTVEYNRKIMEEMKKVIAPFAVSRELSR